MAKHIVEFTVTLEHGVPFIQEILLVGGVLGGLRSKTRQTVILTVRGPDHAPKRLIERSEVESVILDYIVGRLRSKVRDALASRYPRRAWPNYIPREEACLLVAQAIGILLSRLPEDGTDADTDD